MFESILDQRKINLEKKLELTILKKKKDQMNLDEEIARKAGYNSRIFKISIRIDFSLSKCNASENTSRFNSIVKNKSTRT